MLYSRTLLFIHPVFACIHANLLQLCLILEDPMDCVACQAPLSKDSLGMNTGVGYHALLQGIFLTQGLNSRILVSWTGRPVLYH